MSVMVTSASGGLQIHWFSIFNSFMMVIFLTGLVSMILMRTLRNDYAKYAREEDDLETLVRCWIMQQSMSIHTRNCTASCLYAHQTSRVLQTSDLGFILGMMGGCRREM